VIDAPQRRARTMLSGQSTSVSALPVSKPWHGRDRALLRADLEDPKHHDEVLLYEERLSRPQRRRILRLNTYGRKIEKLMNALLKL